MAKLAPYSTLFLRIRYSTLVGRDWTWVRCRIEFCVEWHTLRRGSPIEKWALTRKYRFSGPMTGVFLVRIRYSTWVGRDWTWVRRRIEICVECRATQFRSWVWKDPLSSSPSVFWFCWVVFDAWTSLARWPCALWTSVTYSFFFWASNARLDGVGNRSKRAAVTGVWYFQVRGTVASGQMGSSSGFRVSCFSSLLYLDVLAGWLISSGGNQMFVKCRWPQRRSRASYTSGCIEIRRTTSWGVAGRGRFSLPRW